MKTWETLFNLTSFMKYLLLEALPDESLDSPWYVVESLQELLQTTEEWIQSIKSKKQGYKSTYFYNTQKPVNGHSLPRRPNKLENVCLSKKEDLEVLKPISCFNTNVTDFLKIPQVSEEKCPDLVKTAMGSKTVYLKRKFIRLSNEMRVGTSFGYYCSPCDLVFYTKNDWEKHCETDQTHISTLKLCDEVKYMKCNSCHLVFCSYIGDLEDYFTFHSLNHLEKNQFEGSYITPSPTAMDTDNSLLPTRGDGQEEWLQRSDNGETILPLNSRDTSEIYPCVSVSFIKFDNRARENGGIGFFCQLCSQGFYNSESWNKHFQNNFYHDRQESSFQLMDLCKVCSIEMFIRPSSFSIYDMYHNKRHLNQNLNYLPKEEESDPKIEDNLNPPEPIKQNFDGKISEAERDNCEKKSHGTTKIKSVQKIGITKKFQKMNSPELTIRNGFYCRPCNEVCMDEDETKNHFEKSKHKRIFLNPNYNNWKGNCNFCGLVIIGEKPTIQEYMAYHNAHTKGHSEIPSFGLDAFRAPKKRESNIMMVKKRQRSTLPSDSANGSSKNINEMPIGD